jgi:hypothetical protein
MRIFRYNVLGTRYKDIDIVGEGANKKSRGFVLWLAGVGAGIGRQPRQEYKILLSPLRRQKFCCALTFR